MALTGQDILNSITKAPLSQKVVGLGLIVGLLTAGNWYLLVDPVQQQITRQQAALRQLEDELIRSLAEVGNKSGLVINDIAPQAEQKQSFYAAIPVVMAVTGNYHEVGVFLDAISKLARIVNITNIKMNTPRMSGDKLVVSATYVATTFRFLPETQAQAQGQGQTPPGATK